MDVKIECHQCGEWYVREHGNHWRRKYCSPGCKQKAYRDRAGLSDVGCAFCGERIPAQNKKFCDAECNREWNKEFYAPYQPSIKAILRARAVGDTSIIPELEKVLKDYMK